MFKVKEFHDGEHNWYISDGECNYMHRDGEVVYNTCEYWPTKEQAQAVLDKYQSKHVWEHGDVFDYNRSTMIYLRPMHEEPQVFYIANHNAGIHASGGVRAYIADVDHPATFLFNIKDKLGDCNV